jgi:hypothetical protein
MIEQVTIEPVKPAEPAAVRPEFGRTRDVEANYGLKRGTLYNLLEDGKIRGYLLRVRGQKSGVRVWDLASISQFIRSQQTQSEAGKAMRAQARKEQRHDA